MTRSKFAPWLRRLHSTTTEVRLSAPAMETLAVVAYRQPVLRADVEAIRGVQSGEVLRQLIERDLVRIVGRSGELGRPFLYGTTKQFLQVFGLRHLDELPRADDLRNHQSAEATCPTQVDSDTNTLNPSHQSPVVEEETNVKSLITIKPRQNTFAEDQCTTAICPSHNDQDVFGSHREAAIAEEDDFDDDLDDDDDDDDDDLDDEPWEEVDDEDGDEDWEEDDLDDDDDDLDDDDDDWEDDDEDEDEGKEELV